MTDTNDDLKTELPPGAEGQRPGSRHASEPSRSIGGWSGQKPGRSTGEFLAALHGAILFSVAETGSFNMKQLDHRAEHYLGVSNKEVTIHAGQLVGRPIKDYKLAKMIVLRTLMENARIGHSPELDPDLMDDLQAKEPELFADASTAAASVPSAEPEDDLEDNTDGEQEAEERENEAH